MASPEVVARLRLNASQFSSEGGRAFADMARDARSTSAQVRQTFGADLAEIGKIAQQALNVPRTKAGALDLSGEIAALRQSASAADARALAAGELRNAMQGAAFATQAATEAALRDADAALVDKAAAEQQAAGIRQRIVQLEAYQIELNKSSSAVLRHANDNRVSDEQQRQSKIMLGQQLQDFAVQVGSGQSVATAFTQQIGQASFALQGMGGALAPVAAFLGSGWGIGVTLGLTVLGPLVAKIVEGNDALDDAIDKLKKEADATNIARQAKDRFARSEAGVAAAIRDGTQATKDALEASRSAAEQANINAKRNLDEELSIRAKTKAKLADALADANADRVRATAPGQRGELASLSAVEASNRVAGLQAQLAAQDTLIAEANTRLQVTRADLAAEAAARAVDPMARIKKLYDDQVAAAKAKARAEGTVTTELTKQLTRIEANRQAATKAEQDRKSAANRKPREVSLGQQVSNDQGARILSSAQSFNGLRERDAGDNASLRGLFGTAGIKIDPEKTAWCAAFVSAVLSGQGIKGTGSLAAKSYLGFGTATSKPEKGDVVVLKVEGGNHVGFYAGQKNGRVLVTGGNQSNGQVSTTSFAMSQVAGFRRAPTAAADYKAEMKDAAEAARDAKREQEELERALDGILKALDPAAAAMGRYTDRVADLAKLRAGGKIDDFQQVGYIRDARAELTAAQSKISNDQFRTVIGGAELDATLKDLDDHIKRSWEDLGDQVIDSAQRASDVLRQGADDIAALLGVRVSGPLGELVNGGTGAGFGEKQATRISDALARTGIKIDKKSIQDVTSVLGAASAGRIGGSAFASITGGKDNALASSIGGVLGQQAGKALSKPIGDLIGGTLGKTLGGAAGPLGAIAGGIVGNLVGGLFKKTTQASSTLTFGSDGLSAGAAKGNGTAEKAAASASANSVVGSLNRIAEALGGSVTGAGSVSIGYRPNHKAGAYRVDTSGQGKLTGVLAFATEEEAVRAAIADALSDGVISGISAASKKILAAGGDLEKALTKALLIEAVPKDLKAMLDPLGAAIDELNTKFQKTVDALKEGGATAEQMAQAQQLYDLQLAEVKSSTASASASLKDFLKSLKLGSDSPLSARDREAAALADLQPFLTKIAAGQAIDQGKYQDAAKTYLDIERELYGSTAAFFDAFNAVQASTAAAIATIDNAVPVAAGVESPFAKATAASTAATAAAAQASADIAAQNTELLMRMTTAIEALAAGGGGGAGNFIGNARAFAA